MNNQDVVGRIRYLMAEMRLRQGTFARRAGVDVSNFSKQLNGKLPISDAFVNKIVVNLGVSKDWLVGGAGVPFPKSQPPEAVTVPSISHEHGAPVYDIDATAGVMSREMLFADDRIVGFINVPGMSPDCRIIKVSGDSMTPVVNSGDYIAVREVADLSVLCWGEIYVVVLDDYRMVKYLRRHADDRMVVLRSANPDYDDIDLPRSSIRHLFLVSSIIRIDSRSL